MGFQNVFGHRQKIGFAALSGPPAPVYGPYTIAFAAVVVSRGGVVTNAEKARLTTFENDLGTDITEFDRLWIHGLSNSVAALTSFVNPSSLSAIAVNSPTFTPNQGYNSNGLTSYLNLNYNPLVHSVKFTNTSQSFGSYYSAIPNLSFGEGVIAGVEGLYIFNDTLSFRVDMCSNNDFTTGVQFSKGLNYGVRTGGFVNSVKNSTLNTQTASIFTAKPNNDIAGLCVKTNTSTILFLQSNVTCSVKFVGSFNFNRTNFYNSLQTLGTSLGWAV
jgi:hypothetical protein